MRVEPVNGPLANPDALVHLIPDSLREIFATLAKPSKGPPPPRSAKITLPDCDCGNNPYLAYFVAGQQALAETLVLLQAELPKEERCQGDLAELVHVVRRLAMSEIDTFCEICDHRGTASKCRHASAVCR